MSSRSFYSDYYQTGSAVRKREYKKDVQKKAVVKTNKQNNKKQVHNTSVSIFVAIITVFAMAMFLTYRFNIISEKNLEAQSLKKELAGIEATLASSQIDVEQSTDLNQIESYAKQQLGMQKPDKNQTIYVDTSKKVKPIEVNSEGTFIGSVLNSIKDFIKNIF